MIVNILLDEGRQPGECAYERLATKRLEVRAVEGLRVGGGPGLTLVTEYWLAFRAADKSIFRD